MPVPIRDGRRALVFLGFLRAAAAVWRPTISGDELKEAAVKLYGEREWQKSIAFALGVDPSTVRRWTSGQTPIDTRTALAVRALEERRE